MFIIKPVFRFCQKNSSFGSCENKILILGSKEIEQKQRMTCYFVLYSQHVIHFPHLKAKETKYMRVSGFILIQLGIVGWINIYIYIYIYIYFFFFFF